MKITLDRQTNTQQLPSTLPIFFLVTIYLPAPNTDPQPWLKKKVAVADPNTERFSDPSIRAGLIQVVVPQPCPKSNQFSVQLIRG
jgi:hypothetical protein